MQIEPRGDLAGGVDGEFGPPRGSRPLCRGTRGPSSMEIARRGDLGGAVGGQTAPRRGPTPPLGGLGDGVDDDRDPRGALHVALEAPTRTVTRLITPEHAARGPHHADVGADRGCATPCGTHPGPPTRLYTADHPPGPRRGGPNTPCAGVCTVSIGLCGPAGGVRPGRTATSRPL